MKNRYIAERKADRLKTLEIGLRAAFDELGMEVQEADEGEPAEDYREAGPAARRLVSRWMPVEEP